MVEFLSQTWKMFEIDFFKRENIIWAVTWGKSTMPDSIPSSKVVICRPKRSTLTKTEKAPHGIYNRYTYTIYTIYIYSIYTIKTGGAKRLKNTQTKLAERSDSRIHYHNWMRGGSGGGERPPRFAGGLGAARPQVAGGVRGGVPPPRHPCFLYFSYMFPKRFMLKMKINWNWLEKKDLEKPIGENVRILILIHSARSDLLKTPLNDEFHTRQNRKKIVKNR